MALCFIHSDYFVFLHLYELPHYGAVYSFHGSRLKSLILINVTAFGPLQSRSVMSSLTKELWSFARIINRVVDWSPEGCESFLLVFLGSTMKTWFQVHRLHLELKGRRFISCSDDSARLQVRSSRKIMEVNCEENEGICCCLACFWINWSTLGTAPSWVYRTGFVHLNQTFSLREGWTGNILPKLLMAFPLK
jgi:hypothetical protein